MGRPLTAQTVFTSLALFNVLLAPINSFPWVLNGLVEAAVSVRRLGDFLSMEHSNSQASSAVGSGAAERQPLVQVNDPFPVGSSPDHIQIDNGSFTWGLDASSAVLRDVTLTVSHGALVAVTGDVGAGKTALLWAIMGELQRVQGSVAVRGKAVYVAQDPWVLQGSIRDNVLLGTELRLDLYTPILRACALDKDLADMPAGDRTSVGDRGATLSGGQGSRLALARALYHTAHPYHAASCVLLDDVLASLDANVAAWVLEHALMGPMLHGKTVVAVTHSPALLLAADLVIRVDAGRVSATGSDGSDAHLLPALLPSGQQDGTGSISLPSGILSPGWKLGFTQRSLDPDVAFYLTVLISLAAVNSVFTLARAFAFAQGGLVVARQLHRRLLLAVLALLCYCRPIVEQEMVAVERIHHYLQLAPQPEVLPPWGRPPASLAASSLLNDWPAAGDIAFSDVWLRYAPSGPFVLQRVNLHVPAGTQFGLAGRTGAGKSSVVACLLRLAEVTGGRVSIDGVDVRTVPLRRLRRAVGYCPQSPFLFSGSLRDNMDPASRHNDPAIMSVLKQVGLWAALLTLLTCQGELAGAGTAASVLDTRLGEGGMTLSQGQQQLLSLARVLLRAPKVVCLDECTASLDPGTAEAMHRVMRSCLGGTTVIEVAHRLQSIAGCDCVAVMQAGQVVEVGPPSELLQGRGGTRFATMLRHQQQEDS